MNRSKEKFNPAVLSPQEMENHGATNSSGDARRHFLYPGQIFVSREAITISTILGSCAAVCLWDSRLKIGGMNHYLLPEGPVDGENRLRYGNVANAALLKELLAMGSDLKNLQAKIFGGTSAYAADPITALGTRNVEMAEEFLRKAGIPIAGKDVSGKHGRKLTFNTLDGTTEVKNYQSVT
jgi:chemotaxis protein CheD